MDARQTALRELIGPDITQTSIRDEKTNDRFLSVNDSSFASDVSSIESNQKIATKNDDLNQQSDEFKIRTNRLMSYLKQ